MLRVPAPCRLGAVPLALGALVLGLSLTPAAAHANLIFGAGSGWDYPSCWAQVVQYSPDPVTFLDSLGNPTPLVASSTPESDPEILGAEFRLYGPDLNYFDVYFQSHYGQVPALSFDPNQLVQDIVVYQEETPGSKRWDAQVYFSDISLPVGHYSFYTLASGVTVPNLEPGIHIGVGAFVRGQFDVLEGPTPELPAGALTLISALPLSLVFRRRRKA